MDAPHADYEATGAPNCEEARENGTPFPSFCMLDLLVTDLGIEYTFMYNGSCFHVTILDNDIRGEGELWEDLTEFKVDNEEPEVLSRFEDWVLDALDSFLLRLAPTPTAGTQEPVTLVRYFTPPTYSFKLVNKGGILSAIQREVDPRSHTDTSPKTLIVDTLPPFHESDVVLRSALPAVPWVRASELQRVDDGKLDVELSDMPKKVRRVGTNEVFFFKGGFRDNGHLRELELLWRIQRIEPPLQTSRLVGLVVWDDSDSDMLMGFLLPYIEGTPLAWLMKDSSKTDLDKWMRQVEATVDRLHERDIVWGDAKPDNVMIDGNGNAVVVDFGGGYTPEYIPQELQQTAQGDLMALNEMRREMGLKGLD